MVIDSGALETIEVNLWDLKRRFDTLEMNVRNVEHLTYNNSYLEKRELDQAAQKAYEFFKMMDFEFNERYDTEAMRLAKSGSYHHAFPKLIQGAMREILEMRKSLEAYKTFDDEITALKKTIYSAVTDLELFKTRAQQDMEQFKYELKRSMLEEARATYGLSALSAKPVVSSKRKTV